MGWTSYFISQDDKHFNRKTELDRELWRNNEEYYKLVKSAMVGSTYYAAYEHIPTKTVYGLVCLTSICRDIYGQIEFYYKTIEENMGPNEAKCPESILKLLSPTDDNYAIEWREKCYKYINFNKIYNQKKTLTGVLPYDIPGIYEKGDKVKLYWNQKKLGKKSYYHDGIYRWSKKMIYELENLSVVD